MRWAGLIFFAVLCGPVLAGCPEEKTVVLTFDEEPQGATGTAPSGEVVNFDRPPTRKPTVETLPPPVKLEPAVKLPEIKQEGNAVDPHANVPNYKELGAINKAKKLAGDPRALYLNHCSSCHSFDGTGHLKKPIAGIPDLSSSAVQGRLKDSDIYKAIANGHAGSAGLASVMSGEQITGIADFVRSLRR